MSVVLDAGALVAVDRRDRRVGAMLRVAQLEHVAVRTSAAVVAQVWRDAARQVHLARTLAGTAVNELDLDAGKVIGALLGRSRTRDVVDGHIASVVADGDQLLTSDPDGLRRLLDARAVEARVIAV